MLEHFLGQVVLAYLPASCWSIASCLSPSLQGLSKYDSLPRISLPLSGGFSVVVSANCLDPLSTTPFGNATQTQKTTSGMFHIVNAQITIRGTTDIVTDRLQCTGYVFVALRRFSFVGQCVATLLPKLYCSTVYERVGVLKLLQATNAYHPNGGDGVKTSRSH